MKHVTQDNVTGSDHALAAQPAPTFLSAVAPAPASATEPADNGQATDGQRLGQSADLVDGIAADDFSRNVWSVLGLPVDVDTVASAVRKIDQAARNDRRLAFVTPNVNMLCHAHRDSAARRDILDHDLSLADGAPVVMIARLLGVPLTERVAGSDVFEGLKAQPAIRGRRLKVFFFGGRDGAGAAASDALNAAPSGIESVGSLNPGFGDLEAMSTDAIIDEINAAGPDFVVVALGAAKGNAWIVRNAERLTAPVVSHLGAVVDFAAGTIARAPRIFRRTGLEWAWRIAAEPSLWRRYWSDGTMLAGLFVKSVIPLALRRTRYFNKSAGKTASDGANAQWLGPVGAIALSGDLVDGRLDPVRDTMRRAVRSGRDVTLDFSEAGQIDAAFLGLILMLEKNLAAINAHVTVAGLSPAHRLMLSLHGLRYPETALETGDRAGEPVIADEAQSA